MTKLQRWKHKGTGEIPKLPSSVPSSVPPISSVPMTYCRSATTTQINTTDWTMQHSLDLDEMPWTDWTTYLVLDDYQPCTRDLILHKLLPWWGNVNVNVKQYAERQRQMAFHNNSRCLRPWIENEKSSADSTLRRRKQRSLSVDVTDLARRLTLLGGNGPPTASSSIASPMVIPTSKEERSGSLVSTTSALSTSTCATVGSPLRQCFRPTSYSIDDGAQKSIPASSATDMTIGGGFSYHTEYLRTSGDLFGVPDRASEDKAAVRARQSIKSRLQCAKSMCDHVLLNVLHELNQFVEEGLRYGDAEQALQDNDDDKMVEEEEDNTTDTSSAMMSNTALLHNMQQQQQQEEDHSSMSTIGTPALAMIAEDSYSPTPFILTLQELVGLAQKILNTPLDVFLNDPQKYTSLVSSIQGLGVEWEQHLDWPCSKLYVRLLLGVAAFNRAIEWWEAERRFWSAAWPNTSSEQQDHDHSLYTKEDDMGNLATVPSSRCSSTAPVDLEEEEDDDDEYSEGEEDQPSPESEVNLKQLQEAIDRGQMHTIVMEIGLDADTIQYISPIWHNVTG